VRAPCLEPNKKFEALVFNQNLCVVLVCVLPMAVPTGRGLAARALQRPTSVPPRHTVDVMTNAAESLSNPWVPLSQCLLLVPTNQLRQTTATTLSLASDDLDRNGSIYAASTPADRSEALTLLRASAGDPRHISSPLFLPWPVLVVHGNRTKNQA
jgi:hypothetical protein